MDGTLPAITPCPNHHRPQQSEVASYGHHMVGHLVHTAVAERMAWDRPPAEAERSIREVEPCWHIVHVHVFNHAPHMCAVAAT